MDVKKQKIVIENYIAAYNAFDIEGMLSFVHPNVVFENVAGESVNATANGIVAFRRLALQARALFSSRRQWITGFEADGETIKVEIDYEGVLAIDFPNGMKAGDTLKLHGRSEFQLCDGKLYRITGYS